MEENNRYLFVYGTLLEENNPYATFLNENSLFYQKGRFKGQLYNIGNYPAAIHQPDVNTFVAGSIFYIHDLKKVLKELDEYEGFGDDVAQPNEFIRRLVDVETNGVILKSWVYLYNLPVNSLPQISSGDYLQKRNHKDMKQPPVTTNFNFPGHAAIRASEPPVEFDIADFLYEPIDVAKYADIKDWGRYFDDIPVDPYIKDGYRFKSIAWFRIKHDQAQAIAEIDEKIDAVNKLSGMTAEESGRYLSSAKPAWWSAETGYACWNLPQYAMQQSIKYNPVHGDMRRAYPPVSHKITGSDDFHHLLLLYATFFGWRDAVVLVQFQRVDCYAGRLGLPAVEGFHQDGNRHVGMLVVNRDNVTADSGVSQYVMDDNGKKTDELIFNSVIPPGQLIYWNDKRVWHYGTELKTADVHKNNGRGVRDIVLFSAKIPPANMPMGPVPEEFMKVL